MKREDRDNVLLLVKEKQETAYNMLEEANELLKPMVDDAIKEGSEAVKALVLELPAGYYRAKLRAWLKVYEEQPFDPT